MFRVSIRRPGVAVGNKGYRKQAIGIYLIDATGLEDDFPSQSAVLLGPDDKDYPPGDYTISPSSFGLVADKFGNASLGIKRIVLVPVIKEAGRKAANA